jgi:EmrB/QacA subfamily drug resistance transporter
MAGTTVTEARPTLAASANDIAPNGDRIGSRWKVLVVVALAQLMVVLDGTIVNIALPRAQLDLGMTDSDRTWVVTIYALTFGALLLLGGRIADFWGRKRTFIIGLSGFAIASLIGGFAVSGEMLLVARGFQGAFAALLAPAALSTLSVAFPSGKSRIRAFAVYGTIAGAGAAVGLLLGGVLTQYLNWNWCLWVNVPIAAVAIAIAVPTLKESTAEGDTRYDIPGATLVTLGLGSLVFGFSRAQYGWARPDTIGFLALGVLLIAVFVRVEARTGNPLLPLRVILDRTRAGAFMSSLIVGGALLGGLLYLTLYFQDVRHFTPLVSGIASLPMSATIIIGATFVARLIPKVGPRALMTVGPIFGAAGLLLLGTISVSGNYFTAVLPGEVLLGLGLAMIFVPMQNVALTGVQAQDSGVASAALTATQQVGGSIGTAIFSVIFATAAGTGAASLSGLVDGYSSVFRAASIAILIVAPLAWWFIRVPKDAVASADRQAG